MKIEVSLSAPNQERVVVDSVSNISFDQGMLTLNGSGEVIAQFNLGCVAFWRRVDIAPKSTQVGTLTVALKADTSQFKEDVASAVQVLRDARAEVSGAN